MDEDACQASSSNGVNWLLILPREVRDIIYKYTLTEEGGIIAKTPSDPYFLPRQSGLLVQERPASFSLSADDDPYRRQRLTNLYPEFRLSFPAREPSDIFSVSDDGDVFEQEPSNSDLSKKRDLAAQGYSEALTETTSSCCEFGLESKAEHNRLRHVCRQLREETTGLSIRFNDLLFVDPWRDHYDNNVIFDDHLTSFLTALPSSEIQHLRRIIILDDRTHPYNLSPFMINLKCGPSSSLPDILAQYPQLRIIVRFNWINCISQSYLSYMDTFAHVLRGERPLEKIFKLPDADEDWMDRWERAGCSGWKWSEQIRWTLTWKFEEEFAALELERQVSDTETATELMEAARQVHHDGI